MTVRMGGRFLADKDGALTPDPDDTPTRPIPAAGEAGFKESAATPPTPDDDGQVAVDAVPVPAPDAGETEPNEAGEGSKPGKGPKAKGS